MAGYDIKSEMDLAKDTMQYVGQSFIDILNALIDYGDHQAEYTPYKLMADYLKRDKRVTVYAIQGRDVEGAFLDALYRKNIPHMLVSNKGMVMIPPDFYEEVRQINYQCCIAKANDYVIEVTTDEMEKAIAETAQVKDKSVSILHGLDPKFAESLTSKCAELSNGKQGFTVGKSPADDGTVDFLIPSSKTYTTRSDNGINDLAEAYLAASMSHYGARSQIHIKHKEDDKKALEELKEKIAEKNSQAIYYTSGLWNKTLENSEAKRDVYVKVANGTAELYKYDESIGQYQLGYQAKMDSPTFDKDLRKLFSQILNITKERFTYDELQAELHKEVKLGSDRLDEDTQNSNWRALKELDENLREGVVAVAKHRVETEPSRMMNLSDKAVLQIKYQNEILSALSEGKTDLPGYDSRDLETLRLTIEEKCKGQEPMTLGYKSLKDEYLAGLRNAVDKSKAITMEKRDARTEKQIIHDNKAKQKSHAKTKEPTKAGSRDEGIEHRR
jgi:hypothetical protein